MTKYRNHRCTYDGITFDSKKERARYMELKLLERAGEITGLELQPKFRFEINGKPVREDKKGAKQVTYTADFRYYMDGEEIIEDVKSVITAKTKDFKIKKALFETLYDKKLTVFI